MSNTTHYHAMNGTSGCMPDNNEVFTNKSEAIAYLRDCFDVEGNPGYGMVTALRNTGLFYFRNPAQAGADYAEVTSCDDPDCLIDRE